MFGVHCMCIYRKIQTSISDIQAFGEKEKLLSPPNCSYKISIFFTILLQTVLHYCPIVDPTILCPDETN